MASETLADTAGKHDDSTQSAVVPVLEEIHDDGGPRTDGDFSALAMLLIDSTLSGDDDSLRAIQNWLRDEHADSSVGGEPSLAEARGRISGLLDVSHWAIQRALPPAEIRWVEPGSHADCFLRALMVEPGLSNRDLVDRLAIDESQISRLGRKLRKQGLVVTRFVGRRNCWEVTPKGQRAFELLHGLGSAEVEDQALEEDVLIAPGRVEATPVDELVVATDDTPAITGLAAFLRRLFEAVHPPDRGPYSSEEIASAAEAEGLDVSVSHLSSLLSGKETNASQAAIDALSKVFRISPHYFTDEARFPRKLATDLKLTTYLRDPTARQIAVRALALSPQGKEQLAEFVEELGLQEQLTH
jgi:DNA-binding MarR family transcriptional regulator/transcriptional regulator with XRE-family HTH domain